MKLIEIDGFGEVEFPDEMDDSAINVAIERDILKKPSAPQPVPAAPTAPRSAAFPTPFQPPPVSIPGMGPLAQGPALIEGPSGLQEMPKLPPAAPPAIPFDPQMHAAGYEYFQNKFPMESPEAYAERQVNPAGHSRGFVESLGDLTTSMTDFAYRPLVNAAGIKGDKTYPQDMGERVYAAKQSYLWKAIPDDEKAMLTGRAKAKLQKGITLSKDEELAIQQDAGFWESMQQFAQSAKDHPEATIRELAGEMLAEGPLFVVATRGVGSVLKTAAKARKAMYAKQADKVIHNKIMSGEISPATASRFRSRAETAQKIAQTEQALVKPGALHTIGEEVAEETVVEGAIEAAQAKAAGRDILTPQQAAETAAAGLLGLGLGAGRNALDTRIDAPTYRSKVKDRTVFTPGIENNPKIQDQLQQIASTADSPTLKDQRFRIDSDKAAARRFTGADAPEGYQGMAADDEALVEAGRTDKGRIYLTPYADETTVPEELIHATQDRLRQDQAAMDLRRRIARWEQGVKAEAAEKGTPIPSGDELFAKTFNSHLGNEDPDVASLALPDDIIEDFGAYLGQKTAKGLRGQGQAKAPSIRVTPDDPAIPDAAVTPDDPVIPYDQDVPKAAEPPPMTKEEWKSSPFQLKKDRFGQDIPESWKDEGDDGVSFKPEDFPDDRLEQFSNRLKAKGYDSRGAEDAKRMLGQRKSDDGLVRLDGDQATAAREALKQSMPADKRITPKRMAKFAQKARKVFGTTENYKEAGWLLPEGDLLDFSGKRDGGSPGMRAYDHRDISRVEEDNSASNRLAFDDFKKGGFIRLFPESSGFEIHAKPTPAQAAELRNWIDYHKGDAIPVDVGRGWGGVYPPKTSPVRILRDINDVLDGKTVAPPKYNPDIQGPRYQLKKDEKGKELTVPANVPTFYSALTKTIEQKMGGKGQPDEIMKFIKAQSGIRPEEIEWTGLEKFLESKKEGGKPVTKAEVLDHLKSQDIKVDEVLRGPRQTGKKVQDVSSDNDTEWERVNSGPSGQEKWTRRFKERRFIITKVDEDDWRVFEGGDIKSYASSLEEAKLYVVNGNWGERPGSEMPTKWESYTLPGGKDYRELELTLPEDYYKAKYKPDQTPIEIKDGEPPYRVHERDQYYFLQERNEATGQWHDMPRESRYTTARYAEERLAPLLQENGWGEADTGPLLEPFEYGGHFPEKNVLAFTRFKERKTRDGKRVLFIEEIQSDWFQKMRDEGAITPDLKKRLDNVQNAVTGTVARMRKTIEEYLVNIENNATRYQSSGQAGTVVSHTLAGDDEGTIGAATDIPEDIVKKAVELIPKDDWQRVRDLQEKLEEMRETLKGGAPDAPFKDTWHEMVLKRLVRFAAEEGFDSISWADGATHFERWGGFMVTWRRNDEGKLVIKHKSQVGGRADGRDLEVEAERMNHPEWKQNLLVETDDFRAFKAETNGFLSTHQQKQLWKKMTGTPEGHFVGRKEGYEFFYDKAIPQFLGKFAKKLDPEAKLDKMEVELDPPHIPGKARSNADTVEWNDPESTARYDYEEEEVEDEDVSGYYYWNNEGRRGNYYHDDALGGPYSSEESARSNIREMVAQDYNVEEVDDPDYEQRFYVEKVKVDGKERFYVIDQEILDDQGQGDAKFLNLFGGEAPAEPNLELGIVKAHDSWKGPASDFPDLSKGFDTEEAAKEAADKIEEWEVGENAGKKWAIARGGETDMDNLHDSESEAESTMDEWIDNDIDELYHIENHYESSIHYRIMDPAGDVIETVYDESEAVDQVDNHNSELEDARAERKRELRGNLIKQKDVDINGHRDWIAHDADGDEIGTYATQEEAVTAWRDQSGEGEEPRIEERFMQDQAALPAPKKEEPFGKPGTFLSIPVTDKMKQIALGEGFPKYQLKKKRKAGPQVGPNSHKHKMSQGVPGKGIDQMQGYISYDAKGNQDRSGFLAPLEEAYWKFVDEAEPVLKVENVFEEELQAKDPKAKVNPEESIKFAIDRVRGSGGAARVYIEEKFAPIYRGGTLEGKKLEPLTSKQQQLLDEYLFVERLNWLYQNNEEFTDAGMPPAKAKENLKRIKADPNFKLVQDRAKMVWSYFKDLGYRKLQAGVWTAEEHAQITAEPHYVPLIRDWDKVFNRKYSGATGKGGGGGGKAFTSVNKLVRQISSESTRLPVPIVDPVTAAVMDTHIAAKEIAKMRVWNNVIDMTQQSKELKDWIVELPEDYEPKADEDVVAVRRDQGIRMYLVPRELGEAVNGMGYEAIPSIFKWVAAVSSVFKKYQVGRNLDFAFANLPRDQQEAYFNTGKIPFQYMMSGAKHYFKEDQVWKDYMKLGGSMESGESGMRSSVEAGRKVRYGNKRYAGLDALPPSQRFKVGKKEVGLDDWPTVKKAMVATGRTLVAPLELFEKVGEISEMMSRLGTFEHLQKKGASKQEAIHGARQGTLDFSRIGAQMKTPNAMVPFLNAAVQGTDRNFRTIKKDPLKAAARIALSGLIPAAALLAWNAQNPEYANIKAREKDYYWIVMKNKTGKGYWKLAKGHVQKLFVNPFQLGIETHLGTSHIKGWEVALQTLQGLLPIDDVTSAVPPALAVPIEQAINKEMYWRTDIEKNQGLAPELRYDPWTSETAKKISKGIKYLSKGHVRYSPAKIEHLLGGFFGGFANNSLWMSDQFLQAAGIEVTRDMTIERAPVIRRMFGIAQDWKSDLETQLRTKRKEFLEAERAMGVAGKRGDQDENKAYLLELKKEMDELADALKAVRALQEKAKEEVKKQNGIRKEEGN